MNTTENARIRRMQWTSVSLLLVAGIINYLDRSSLGIANVRVATELGLSATKMGLLLSSFSWVLAFALLPIGGVLDRFGTRKVLAAGLLVWSVAQIAGGFVSSVGGLFVVRALLALGESPQYPSGSKVVSEWFPVHRRGLPIGLILASTTLGSMLAPPLQTLLLLSFGWRTMFVIMGAIGIPVALVWYLLYRNRDDEKLSAAENAYLDAGDTLKESPCKLTFDEWIGLFRQRTTWAMMFGFMGILYMVYLHLAWLPNYLQRERHLSIAHSGWAAAVPYLFGTVGMLCSGVVADWLMRHGTSAIVSRKIPLCAGLLGAAAFTVPAAFTDSAVAAVAYISAAMLCLNLAGGSVWGLVSVAAPRHLVASLGSIQNFGASIGAAFAPFVTGWIVDTTHSFVDALLVSAALAVLSAGCYLFCVNRPIETREPRRERPVAI
ncbi:MFS transporter [Paraburkholderia sediminicola]|uniref:MFS transporter n=1 Tax=Paraburkholderia sediminicola TaxID=458836 RepID=UPI0038B9A788